MCYGCDAYYKQYSHSRLSSLRHRRHCQRRAHVYRTSLFTCWLNLWARLLRSQVNFKINSMARIINKSNPSPVPRGIRNNNPLNIRIGNTWLGEVSDPTDSEFEQFVSLQYGIRAAFCILRRYIRVYKRNTVERICSAWAPSSENNTSAYIAFVANRANLILDAPLLYEDRETMCRLVQAMAFQECGLEIPIELIKAAYDIA